MTIEKAFERLYWRFGTKTTFSPNQNDLEALNRIAEYINKLTDEKILQHQLFAKLYTQRLTDLFGSYRDLAFALSVLDSECAMPLSHYVDLLHFEYNLNKYKMYCEEKGLTWDEVDARHPETRAIILDLIISDSEYRKHFLGYWPVEKVEMSLKKQIIKEIENHAVKI